MKKKNKILLTAIAVLLVVPFFTLSQDSAKKTLLLNISYYMNNNKAVYVIANAKTKIAGKFIPVNAVTMNLFLDTDSLPYLIGKVTTDKNGAAKAILPPALQTAWNQSAKHVFKAVAEGNKEFEAADADISITKARITIDTAFIDSSQTIIVKVTAFDGTNWLPVPDVEMKVGISRSSGAILSAGDEATYTTDSAGTVSALLKKINLPGDENGNLILAAKVEDNDQLGNLVVEKTVPWGIAVKADNSFFNQRALWATRFRTPLWLLFMAYSIVIGVWGTIIYLVIQIIRIKRMGVKYDDRIA